MTYIEFKGIIPPTLTLFNENGQINEQYNRDYLEFLITSGIHGLFIGGSNGLGPMMSIEQRKFLTEISLNQINGRVTSIIHVGSPNFNTSLELAKHAEKFGANAIASVPPYYYRYNKEEVVSFFENLSKNINIPVLVYNNPTRTGFLVTPDIAVELAQRGVRGIKDSAFNLVSFFVMKEKMEVLSLDFQCIIGTDALWLPSLIVGTKAVISAIANVFPRFIVDFYNKSIKEGMESAADIQLKVIRIRNLLETGELNIPKSLAALELLGINPGKPLSPFKELDISEKQILKEELEKEGML